MINIILKNCSGGISIRTGSSGCSRCQRVVVILYQTIIIAIVTIVDTVVIIAVGNVVPVVVIIIAVIISWTR